MCISLYTIADKPPHEISRERAVQRSGVLANRHKQGLATIAAEGRARLGTAMAAISVVHQDSTYLLAASGFPDGAYRRSTSLCAHAILSSEALFVILDALADTRFAGNPYVEAENGVRFYAAVPLSIDDRYVLGTFCVFDPEPRGSISTQSRNDLVRIGAQVVALLRSDALYETVGAR